MFKVQILMGKIVKEVLSLETKYDKLLRTLQTSLSFIQYKQILDMCARKKIEENFLGERILIRRYHRSKIIPLSSDNIEPPALFFLLYPSEKQTNKQSG